MQSQEILSTVTTALVVAGAPILAAYVSMLLKKITAAAVGYFHNRTASILLETLMKHADIAVAQIESSIVRDAKDPTKTGTSWTDAVKQDAKTAAMDLLRETSPDLITQLKVSDKMLGSVVENAVAGLRNSQPPAAPTPSMAPPAPVAAPVIPVAPASAT